MEFDLHFLFQFPIEMEEYHPFQHYERLIGFSKSQFVHSMDIEAKKNKFLLHV